MARKLDKEPGAFAINMGQQPGTRTQAKNQGKTQHSVLIEWANNLDQQSRPVKCAKKQEPKPKLSSVESSPYSLCTKEMKLVISHAYKQNAIFVVSCHSKCLLRYHPNKICSCTVDGPHVKSRATILRGGGGGGGGVGT